MKSFKEFLAEDANYNARVWVTHQSSDQHNVPKRIRSAGETPEEVRQNANKYFRDQGYEVHHVEHLG